MHITVFNYYVCGCDTMCMFSTHITTYDDEKKGVATNYNIELVVYTWSFIYTFTDVYIFMCVCV